MEFKRGVFHSFFHKQALVFHRYYVELDVKRSDVLFKFNTMNIYCTISTQTAVYFFVVNHDINLARITKQIRKGHKGYDCSTTMSVDQARKFVKQLQTR